MDAHHAFARNRDNGLPRHDGNRLDRIFRGRASRGHFRAGRCWLEKRPNVQHDTRAGNRNERSRVEHLGAVMGKLASLSVVQLRNQTGVWNEARIGGQNAGHVLPENDLSRTKRAREQRG